MRQSEPFFVEVELGTILDIDSWALVITLYFELRSWQVRLR